MGSLSLTCAREDTRPRPEADATPKTFDQTVFTVYVPEPDGGGYLFNGEALVGDPGVWYVKDGVATKVIDERITTITPAPEGGFYAFNGAGVLGTPGVWYLRNGRAVRVREESQPAKSNADSEAQGILDEMVEQGDFAGEPSGE